MTATRDYGETSWGSKWRRCPTCKRRVWLTKTGKMCKHVGQGHPGKDPFAVLSSGLDQSVPRCPGDKQGAGRIEIVDTGNTLVGETSDGQRFFSERAILARKDQS